MSTATLTPPTLSSAAESKKTEHAYNFDYEVTIRLPDGSTTVEGFRSERTSMSCDDIWTRADTLARETHAEGKVEKVIKTIRVTLQRPNC